VTVSGTQIIEGENQSTVVAHRSAQVREDDRLEVHGGRQMKVEKDLSEQVGGSRTSTIEGTDSTTVTGSVSLSLGSDLTANVKGSIAALVGRSDAKRSLVALVEGPTQLTSTGTIELASESDILLRVGSSFLRVSKSGIEIGGGSIALHAKDARIVLADGKVKSKVSSKFQVMSDSDIVLKSSGASLGLDADAKVSGSSIKLGSSTDASDDESNDDPQPAKITLTDQDGNPVPYQRYVVTVDGGQEVTGFLDHEGKATIPIEDSGELSFPDLAHVEEQ
jgi:hypothetical protein